MLVITVALYFGMPIVNQITFVAYEYLLHIYTAVDNTMLLYLRREYSTCVD